MNKLFDSPFSENKYTDARLNPSQSDRLYFHFSDLRTALSYVDFKEDSKILDFGCGSSPYKSVIPHKIYHKADYKYDNVQIDYEIVDDKLYSVKSDFYDFVLSTQVLEHVSAVSTYLKEANRVLKSSGKIVLTTHGIFEEHPCPFDFWRWTADGLELEIQKAGFTPINIYKLTGGLRFNFMQFEEGLQNLHFPNHFAFNSFIRTIRFLFFRIKTKLVAAIDRSTSKSGVHLVTKADPGPDKYVALMVVAAKYDG
jgi:SAM-dependent methyltransferase